MARKPGKKKPTRRQSPKASQGVKALNECTKTTTARASTAGNFLHRHKPDINIDRAQLAWKDHRFDEAIRHYEKALARDPTNAVLLVDVARAYGLRYRCADAERLVDQACELHSSDADLQRMLGRSYLMLQQFDRAIACYLQALKLDPTSEDNPRTLFELAKMYERLHDLESARQCANEAHELAPNWDRVIYQLAIIERRAGDTETAQNRLQELIESDQVSAGVAGDAWYEIAAIQDKSHRYADAYKSLTLAKDIFTRASADARRDATNISKTASRTFGAITCDHFDRWSKSGEQLPPVGNGLALLTSHPRSGTTLLEQVVDCHAGLISADELQIMTQMVFTPIFQGKSKKMTAPDVLDEIEVDSIINVRQNYFRSMEGALRESIGNRILLDKNPAMTGLLPLVGRVFPEMKILFALRDPRDVVISCFMQRLPLNSVSVHYLSIEETANEYAATMRHWLKIRDIINNPWIEVRYEDMVANMERQSQRILKFLDLPWDSSVLNYHQRAQRKHVHSPTYESVTKPVYATSIGRWRNYEKYLEPTIKTLQPFIDEFGY